MTLPDEGRWLRVERIAAGFNGLDSSEAALRLRELLAQGESASILSIVSSWIDLPALTPPLGPGDVLAGRYVLRQKLGEGGMGAVWRATQQLIARDVAVKIIQPALVTPALCERFEQEMKILGQLEHPGIVRIFDAGLHEHDGETIPFFVMECIEGEPLSGWAASRRADRVALLRVMSKICAAVQHAHDRKIVHRDLKPSNIMMRPDGHPVVLDFGIARLAGGGPEELGFSGTPHYAPPEQHLGCDGDFRSGESVDIYAAGAILFEILGGRRLFDFPRGLSIAEMRRRIVEGTPPRLAEVLGDCPAPIDELVARAVRRNPEDRFFSIALFSSALTRTANRLYGPPRPPLPPWAPAAGLIVPDTNWRLMQQLGQGSTGQVWLAAHESLPERRVFKFCDSEEKVRTLKRELTLFRLLKERIGENPHFIPLHEVAIEEPPWYLMMDHVEAQDLTTWCAAQPGGLAGLELAVKVELIVQAAEALQAAHGAGILHLDIKPANLLIRSQPAARIAEFGGTAATLHVFVADFGAGQIVTNEVMHEAGAGGSAITLGEVRRSTLSDTMFYLAPEVIEGNQATPRSDIYSLGVVLWQLLVGNFHAALDPVAWPTRIADPLLRQDLDRCLAGSLEHRWPSTGALAASLRALAQRRATETKRQFELARRTQEAHRRGAARAILIAAVVMLILAYLTWFAWQKSQETKIHREGAALGQARATLGELQSLSKSGSPEAHELLRKEMPRLEISDPALRHQFQTAAITILAQNPFAPIEPAPVRFKESDMVADLGERMIAINEATGLMEVVNLASPLRSHRTLAEGGESMTHPRISVRGLVAGAVAANGDLHLWEGSNLDTDGPVKHTIVSGPVYAGSFAFSPTVLDDSGISAVAIARPDGTIEVLPMGKSDRPAVRLERKSTATEDAFPETTPASLLEFAREPQGVLAAAGPDSSMLLFWHIDLVKNGVAGTFAGSVWHREVIRCIKWNPSSPELASGGDDGILRVWLYSGTGKIPQTNPNRMLDLGEPIREISWSSDGRLIAVLLDSGTIRVLRGKTLEEYPKAIFHQSNARRLAFLGSDFLAVWGGGKTSMWGKPELYFLQRAISTSPVEVDFHQNGSLMTSTSDSINFLVPHTLTWTSGFLTRFAPPAFWLGSKFIFYKDKWKLATTLKLFNPERLKLEYGPDPANAQCYVASPQGHRMASFQVNQLHVWQDINLEEGRPAQLETLPANLAISDMEPITAWTDANGVQVHNHRTGQQRELSAPVLLGLVFSPESGLLAGRSEAGVLFVDMKTSRTVLCPIPAPDGGPTPISFSADGRWLTVCGAGHEVLLGAVSPRWRDNLSLLEKAFVQPVKLHPPTPARIVSLRWNSTGSRLACGTADGQIQSWNLSLLRRQLRLWNMDWSTDPIPIEPAYTPITLY